MSGPTSPDRRGRPAAAPVLVVLLAALVATLVAFRPTLSPLGLQSRATPKAVALGQLMVDTRRSGLVDIDVDATAPSEFALTYVQYLRTAQARRAIAAAAGVPWSALAVNGPYTALLNRTSLRRQVLPQPKTGPPRYRLLVDAAPKRPVVTLIAAAPDTAQARRLVNVAAAFLRGQVAALRAGTPPGGEAAAVLRPLGTTMAAAVRPTPVAAVFALVFGGVLALAAAGVAVRRRHRDGPPHAAAPVFARDDDWPHTTRKLPWCLAAFMTMVLIVPFAAVPFPGKLDRAALLGLAIVWAVTLRATDREDEPPLRIGVIHAAAVLLFAACAAGVVLNAGVLGTLSELGPSVKKVALLGSLLAFLVIAGASLRPAEVPRFVSLLLGLAALVAVGTVIEYRTGTNIFYGTASLLTGGRVSTPPQDGDSIGRLTVFGPTSHPLEVATMLGMALAFAVVRVLDSRDRRELLRAGALAALLLAGAMATQRKTGAVAPAAALLVVAAYRPRAVVRRLLPLTLVLGLVIHLLAPGAVGSVFSQLQPANATSTLSTQDRASDYAAVAPDVSRHLLLGRGLGSYEPYKYRILDNQYLGLIVQAGVLGLVAYLALLGSAALVAHRVGTARGGGLRGPSAVGAVGAVAVVAVASALFDVFSFPHVTYLLFLICGFVITLAAPDRAPRAPDADAGRARAPGAAAAGPGGRASARRRIPA